MTVTHHKFLVHPTTNEVFSWRAVNTATNQIISEHKNLRPAFDEAERLNVEAAAGSLPREVRGEVPRCGYQDDRYELPCAAPATVTDMETGSTFCPTHFQEVIF